MATADFSSSFGSESSSGAALQSRLKGLARRRNAQKMTRALVRAAIPGVGLAALSIALYKLHIIEDGPIGAPLAMIGASLLWGFRNGWMQRAGSFAAACDADIALGLDDRLSSALAFSAPDQVQRRTRVAAGNSRFARLSSRLSPRFALSSSPAVAPTILVPPLVAQAATRAQSLDASKVYPLRFDRPAQIMALLSLLLIGACLMPDYAIFQTAQQKKQVAAMQAAGEKLVEVAKTVRKTEPPKAAEVQQLAQRLQKLGQKMVRGRMTKRAALTEMGELRQELKKAQQKKSTAAQSGNLPQIAEALREAPLQSDTGRKVQEKLGQNKPDDAAKALEELADKVEKNQLSAEEKNKAAEDLKKTAQDLRSRGGQANQDAAKQLEKAAEQLQKPGQNPQQQPQGQNPQSGQQQQGGQKNPQEQKPQQGQGQQQQQAQSPQNGQKPQQGQKQQSGQQSPQQQNSQSQSGAQQGQQQQQQGGQQGQSQQGQSQQGQGQQGDQQSAADSLRNMANGLRSGGSSGSNSQGMQDMMNKIREAENQTGTNSGEQSGQGKPGQGSGSQPGSGQGQMKSVTPGKDLMPTDPHGKVGGGAGLGPRNNAQGNNSGGGVSKVKGNRTGDKRRYGDVWSDRLPKTHAKIDRVTGKWGENGEVEQMPTKGEAKGGQVKTPYYQVYESYKRDAEEAVGRESVPPAYKQPVKDYFDSIKP